MRRGSLAIVVTLVFLSVHSVADPGRSPAGDWSRNVEARDRADRDGQKAEKEKKARERAAAKEKAAKEKAAKAREKAEKESAANRTMRGVERAMDRNEPGMDGHELANAIRSFFGLD